MTGSASSSDFDARGILGVACWGVMVVRPAETFAGKCCYVVRLSDPFQPLPTKDVEDRLNFGTIAGNGAAMQTLNRLVGELYNPLIAANQFGFKKKMGPDQVESLQGATSSFCVTLEKVRAHAHARGGGSTPPV